MNSAIASINGGRNIGIGYAVPIDLVRRVAAELLKGPPSWGDAGLNGLLSTITPEEAQAFGLKSTKGAVAVMRNPNTGPGKGKLFAYDLIYEIGESTTPSAEKARQIVANHRAGEQIKFTLIRSGEPLDVTVELTEGWKGKPEPEADRYDGLLGMDLEMWDHQNDRKT